MQWNPDGEVLKHIGMKVSQNLRLLNNRKMKDSNVPQLYPKIVHSSVLYEQNLTVVCETSK